MSGVLALAARFRANAVLTAVVPATSINEGPLPLNTPLPAIALEQISSVDLRLLCPEQSSHVTARVQATVAAASVRQRRQIINLMRTEKAWRGDMPELGIVRVNIMTDGQGPDFMDEAARLYMRTQDYLVAFNEGAA